MNKKPPLTKKKSKWVKNRNVVLRGKKLHYNVSHQIKYISSLKKLVNLMTKETKKELMKLFKTEKSKEYFNKQKQNEKITFDESISSQAKIVLGLLNKRFSKLFSLKSKQFSKKMISNISNISKSNLHSSLKELSGGLSLKTGIVTKGMEEISKSLIFDNVNLIESIQKEYHDDVSGAVFRSITSGNGLGDLIEELNKYEGITERRAKNIALDQTRKAYNYINKERMQNVGVKQFEWVHSAGSIEPRKSHIKIDGHIFSFENLEKEQIELGVPEKDQGLPGVPIYCRCIMVPVIDFSEKD